MELQMHCEHLLLAAQLTKRAAWVSYALQNIVDAKAMLYNTLGLPMQLHLDGLAYAAHTTCCCRTP